MIIDFNYWTKVARKIAIIVITIIFVYLGFKLAVFYMPFLIAFIISLMLEPAIRFMMRKLKFRRKQSSIVIIVLIMGILIGLLIWGISSLVTEGYNFLNNINSFMEAASTQIQNILSKVNLKKLNIPENILEVIENSSKEMLNTFVFWIENAVKHILNFITSIPTIGIYFSITFLALYFICSDKVYIIDQFEHHLPELWVKKIYIHIKDLVKVLGRYLKAEVILIFISFVISLIRIIYFSFCWVKCKIPATICNRNRLY